MAERLSRAEGPRGRCLGVQVRRAAHKRPFAPGGRGAPVPTGRRLAGSRPSVSQGPLRLPARLWQSGTACGVTRRHSAGASGLAPLWRRLLALKGLQDFGRSTRRGRRAAAGEDERQFEARRRRQGHHWLPDVGQQLYSEYKTMWGHQRLGIIYMQNASSVLTAILVQSFNSRKTELTGSIQSGERTQTYCTGFR